MRFRVVLPAVLMMALLAPSAQGQPTIVNLSELSSEPSTNPASELSALVIFAMTAADEVTVSVTNLTSASAEYDINRLLLNVTSNVTGLTLLSVTQSVAGNGGWELLASTGEGGETHQGGFGIHDFSLSGPGNLNSNKLMTPGETIDFVLQVVGTGPFSEADFVTELSVQPSGNNSILTMVAAKFVNGPTLPDSTWGAMVPEPGTLALALIGGLALGMRRRRR